MTLKPEEIAKFKQLYREHFNEEISDAEAYEAGQNLVNFMKLLIDIEHKQDSFAVTKNNNDSKEPI